MGVSASRDYGCPLSSEQEEICPRCGAAMIWTKASWHCLACRYKEGCCG